MATVITEQRRKELDAEFALKFKRELVRENLIRNKNVQLSKEGFEWAIFICMSEKWPDVSFEEANLWIKSYVEDDVSYLDDSYAWTYSDAEEIVDSYIDDFGEFHAN